MGRRSSHCGLGAPRQARSYEPALRIFLSFLALFVGMPPQVWASPSGPQVVHGQVQFQQIGLETRITVDNVTSSDLANVSGTVFLLAGGNGSVTFSGSPSSFPTLDAAGEDGVNVNANVSTTTGNLLLEGDADLSASPNNDVDVAAGVSLNAGATLILRATGGINAAGAVNLNANEGLNLDNALTATGAVNIDADLNNDDGGTVNLPPSGNITTNNNALNITAADITIAASVDAGSGNITIAPSVVNTSIAFGDNAIGNLGLGTSEVQFLNSSGLVTIGVAGGNGDLNVQTIDLSGESFDLTLLAGDVKFGDPGQTGSANTGELTMPNASTLRIISSGAIIDANDNIGANGNHRDINFSGGAGTLLMQAQNSIGDPGDSSGAGIFFLEASASSLAASSANGDIRISNFDTNVAITAIDSTNGLSTNGGNISLQVGGSVSFGLELAIPTNLGIDTIRSAGGNVLLNSGDIIINTGGGSNAVNSANGDVFFGPTRSMTLGATVASTYSIDDAELDVVDPGAGPVNLGNQFNIAISLAGNLSPANIDTLFINGQQGLDSTNTANTISATNVAIFVHNSIGSTNAIRVDADNLAAVSNVTGDIAIEDVDDVTIANVVVTTGSTIPGLQSTASDITVTSNGTMTIAAQAVAHSNGNLTLTAANGDIALNQDIGSDSGTFNGNVDGNGTGTVHLDAQSGAITTDGSSAIKTAGTTILQSATGIGSSANPIDTSSNTIAATSGDDAFINESDAVTIGSSGGVIGLTTTGSNGEIRLTAGGSIVVSNPVSAHGTGNVTLAAGGAGSDLTVNANVDTAGGDVSLKSGTGNSALMTISSNVISGGGNIVLRADTADVSATVEAGNGEILFSTATQDGTRVIDLGTDFVTTLSLNDSELDRLNTNSLLTIGDTNTDDVQIWSSINPNNAANTTLISGDQIEGNSSGSTLQAGGILTLDAENGILGLSGTGNQSLAIDAETLAARSRSDASVKITEANNVTIASSNGATSAFNGIEGGNVDFEATNTITISVGIATNGDLLLSAGDDIAGGTNDIDAEGSVTITGDNITIGSITSEGGVNVTATGTLTMSSTLDGGGNDVGITAGSFSALVDGLLVTDANAVTFNTSSISINGGDFNIDNVAGRVDIQGTTSINVAGNNSFIASTRGSVLDLNNADILARNIQLLATSGEVTMSGGQLAVSQDGGQVNIQQSVGLSISESSIVLGGDTSFMDLNVFSNSFVSFFAGLRLSNALHLNSVSAVGSSSGVFVDGVLLADNAINLTSSSGFISAGVNPIIAGGLLTISALGSSGSNIHAGTVSGVGVNLTAGETITLARTIDANGGNVNISATTLRGRNGLEIRDASGVSIGAQVQLDSGIFTINGVNQNANTAIRVTGARTPALETIESVPTILEIQTIRSIRVVDEVTRIFEANRIVNDIQALNSLAETLESSPDSFGSLLKTNHWLREAQSVIDYTREMLRNAGKEPSIAGEIFIQLYCSDLVETHPKTFELLKGLADSEDEE